MIQKQPTISKVNISFMGEVGPNNNSNGSPHGEVYKSSKRNNVPSNLEYQYATNSNGGNVNVSSIQKPFFPNLRSKGTQPRESNLAQNGQNSVFPLNSKPTRVLALPSLNEASYEEHNLSSQQLAPSSSSYQFQLQGQAIIPSTSQVVQAACGQNFNDPKGILASKKKQIEIHNKLLFPTIITNKENSSGVLAPAKAKMTDLSH